MATRFSRDVRNVIRKVAEKYDARYRITRNAEIHFYGTIPNTNTTGWYFVGYVGDFVRGIAA